METIADQIIRMLQCAGVQRLFGMPGGGSNADLIEAAGRAGLPFSLAHTETASAFMATAQAEITGKAGACLATLGPGAASLMNGVANAHLDRVPLIFMTDCRSEAASAVMEHQTLRQGEMFSTVRKWGARLTPAGACEALQRAGEELSTLPSGPVHLDLSGDVTEAGAEPGPPSAAKPSNGAASAPPIPPKIQSLLRRARRPLLLIGLGARTKVIAAAVRGLSERFGIPALVTYKAKGVVPDRNAWFGGVLTNGALERDVLEQADVFLAIGMDPVELLPRPWTLPQPVISITSWAMNQKQVPLAAELVGDIASGLEAIAAFLPGKSDWVRAEVCRLAQVQRDRMRPQGEPGALLPHRVVELAAEAYPGARATVDAGAHMFPVMSLWPAEEPSGVLISNGLATMGFALPAAIGAALLDPSKPTLAFTGDGGLLMCLGELLTAAREALPLRIIVFDDSALSLIKIKQIQRGYRTDGVSIGSVDWKALGAGLGMLAHHVDGEEALRVCLRDTAGHPGPVLIAAQVAPEAYQETIRALRG